MAIVSLPAPVIFSPYPYGLSAPSFAATTLDAAGESLGGVGTVILSTGRGTSKVLSAAGGGEILIVPGTNTFANGSTVIRVGVNDLTGNVEDGTHDVYGELTGGVDTLTSQTPKAVAMSSGSKTIADGDPIAIIAEMTGRGGADTVDLSRLSSLGLLSTHLSIDSGSGPGASAGTPLAVIRFDDGTIGWLIGSPGAVGNAASSVSAGGTPDEYAIVFTPTVPLSVVGIVAHLSSASGATDAATFALYTDPTGTPNSERTATALAGTAISAAAGGWTGVFASAYTCVAGTTYAATVRVTGGAISINRFYLGAGNDDLRAATQLGTAWRQATRSGGTGAFSNDATDDEYLPLIGLLVQGFDDAASGGGPIIATDATPIIRAA